MSLQLCQEDEGLSGSKNKCKQQQQWISWYPAPAREIQAVPGEFWMTSFLRSRLLLSVFFPPVLLDCVAPNDKKLGLEKEGGGIGPSFRRT